MRLVEPTYQSLIKVLKIITGQHPLKHRHKNSKQNIIKSKLHKKGNTSWLSDICPQNVRLIKNSKTSIIHHKNRIKRKNYTIILINGEKALDKIQHQAKWEEKHNLCLHKNLSTDVHRKFIRNSQSLNKFPINQNGETNCGSICTMADNSVPIN